MIVAIEETTDLLVAINKDKTFCVNDKCLIKTTCADYLREEIKEQAKKAKLPLSCTNFNCDINGGNHG